jgi:hypothetical protein
MSINPAAFATAGLQVLNSADAKAVLEQMVAAVQQWQQTVETEQSKRAAIVADERKWITAIETDRQILLTYLDASFDERAANFRRLFDSLDQAMTANPSQVADALGAITTLAMKSPFNNLKDVATVTANLENLNFEW